MNQKTDWTEADNDLLALDRQFCFVLYALSRRVTQLYRPLLEPLGLTYPQYLVLLVLWEARQREPAFQPTVTHLCDRLLLDTGTLTPLLKRLAQQGLIARQRSMVDERSVTISLTEQGAELRERALEIPGRLIQQSGLPPSRFVRLQQTMRALLRRLTPRQR